MARASGVAYVMLNLRGTGRQPDLRRFVRDLEDWLIDTVADFGITAFRRDGRIGVWVEHPSRGEAKIGALGVRVRHWVTYHGVSLNIEPDLAHYGGIVPCGIPDYAVTSLVDLGLPVTMAEVDARLWVHFEARFGATVAAPGADGAEISRSWSGMTLECARHASAARRRCRRWAKRIFVPTNVPFVRAAPTP